MGWSENRSEVLNQHGQVVLRMEGVGFFRRRRPGAASRLIRVT
jgi:hypothetical protein